VTGRENIGRENIGREIDGRETRMPRPPGINLFCTSLSISWLNRVVNDFGAQIRPLQIRGSWNRRSGNPNAAAARNKSVLARALFILTEPIGRLIWRANPTIADSRGLAITFLLVLVLLVCEFMQLCFTYAV